ncbi:universal stress protein [Streptomyces pratens]|uniref:Universal stress protein n=1 Tax=Streptomyces pratens TaxID=887456 RepID=A0ABW1LZ35_9ACTN
MELTFLDPAYARPGPCACAYLDTSRDLPDPKAAIDLRRRHLREDLARQGADDATVAVVVGVAGTDREVSDPHGVGLTVAGQARCPVVVVRGTERPPGGVVVVGVRDDGDIEAVCFAGETARRRKASLRLLSAWSYPQYVGSTAPMADVVRVAVEAEAAASTRMLGSAREEFPDLRVTEEVVRVPSPAGELVAASMRADLVVVGAHKRAHHAGRALGRVTHAVLQHAHCPVAVVPRR